MAESLIAITEGSGANVSTQSMTINSQTVEIERSMMGIGVVTLPGSADSGGTPLRTPPSPAPRRPGTPAARCC